MSLFYKTLSSAAALAANMKFVSRLRFAKAAHLSRDVFSGAAPVGGLLVGLLLALPACKATQTDSPSAQHLPAKSEQPFDPAVAKPKLALAPTQVMIFGIGHLDTAPASFQVAWLEPVLCRLRTYKPDLILTEAMSGEQIMGLEAYAAYHGTANQYAGPTLAMAKAAQADLHLTAAQALVQANELSEKGNLTPADRRRLAGLFVAAAEPLSATVQWLRLPMAERIGADGISPALAKQVTLFANMRNEMSSMAARLAADLGLERVYGAGDHASDVTQPDFAALKAAVSAESGQVDLFNHNTPEFRAVPEEALKMATAAEVMPALKWKNSPRFAELDADAQWLSMLRSEKMGRVGRQRVAAWEAQNLRMAVAIREATAPIAGGRALLIVGASHKPFLEAYLRTFTDVELVSVPALLNAKPVVCPE
ncbi:DUF5694 domain-containing protein [Hymenobacter volaticus]|uniref:DUF5694 domain-containing protein n=1 Tax=Hymenobacter volaticus TaxID=2932254 RepID=A0ABY4GDR7_9BACT|nr:DUF5694 domain-containing protein [Hymenobacter volaticus]UOQ68930.1 DUF5694 domain-containing protein [Hymenobacter volaticus]